MTPAPWLKYSRLQELDGQLEANATETPENEALRRSFVEILSQHLPPPARILAPGALAEAFHLASAGYEVVVPQMGRANLEWLSGRGLSSVREMDVHALTFPDSSFDGYFSCQVHEHLLAPMVHIGEARRCLRDGAIVFVDACGIGNEAMDTVAHLNLVPAATVARQWTYWGFRELWRGPHGDGRPQFVFEKLPWSAPEFKHSAILQRFAMESA